MVLLKSIAGLSLASVASASPYQLHARQNSSSPCAAVASSVATQTIAVPTVPAQLAYDCITSVPFNQSAALALVDGIVPYVRWQSTTAYLKDPPKEYVEKIQDPVDLWGDLEIIREKVVNGSYENEFEVRSISTYLYRVYPLTCYSSDSSSTFSLSRLTTATLFSYQMSLAQFSTGPGKHPLCRYLLMARNCPKPTFTLMFWPSLSKTQASLPHPW
jgi:hypothetical protein